MVSYEHTFLRGHSFIARETSQMFLLKFCRKNETFGDIFEIFFETLKETHVRSMGFWEKKNLLSIFLLCIGRNKFSEVTL